VLPKREPMRTGSTSGIVVGTLGLNV